MTKIAKQQRAELAELLHDVGPLAPTLCEGWNARDLVAHLYVRENQPANAVGIFVAPLNGITERAMIKSQQEHNYEELVEMFAVGPRGISPFRIHSVDEQANGLEFFIHFEDVARAQEPPVRRFISPETEDYLWQRVIALAKLKLRRAKVGVTLERKAASGNEQYVVSLGPNPTVIAGKPSELALWLSGRSEHADVEISGAGAEELGKLKLEM